MSPELPELASTKGCWLPCKPRQPVGSRIENFNTYRNPEQAALGTSVSDISTVPMLTPTTGITRRLFHSKARF